jgi:hypothetical protein
MKTITLTSFLGAITLVACSSQAPQKGNNNRSLNNAYDQNPYFNSQGQNRAPTLAAISPISVNAGSSYNINLIGSDPENAIVRYIVTCPPEVGGTQQASRGSFTMQTSRELQTQDVQCGAMVIDNVSLQGKQLFVVKVKGTGNKKSNAFDVTGTLARIAFPVAVRAFGGRFGQEDTSRTWTSSTRPAAANNSGQALPAWSDDFNWDSTITKALQPGSDFLKYGEADLGLAYANFTLPDSSGTFDYNKFASENDYSKLFSTSGTGTGSGFSFKDIWNSNSISYDAGNFKFDPSAALPEWDFSKSYTNAFSTDVNFQLPAE